MSDQVLIKGTVSPAAEHIELLWGDSRTIEGVQGLVAVARLALAPSLRQLILEFTPNAPAEAATAVQRDIEVLFAGRGQTALWEYARYHCSSAANVYGRVHWVWRDPSSGQPGR